jgi:hypothetical protein
LVDCGSCGGWTTRLAGAGGWRWLTGSTPKHFSQQTRMCLNTFNEYAELFYFQKTTLCERLAFRLI